METGKTTPDIIVINGGLEGATVAQLAMIKAIQAENPNCIVLTPQELRKRGIDELNRVSESQINKPFENPPKPYVLTERFENFRPPPTRQERRAKERKQYNRKN